MLDVDSGSNNIVVEHEMVETTVLFASISSSSVIALFPVLHHSFIACSTNNTEKAWYKLSCDVLLESEISLTILVNRYPVTTRPQHAQCSHESVGTRHRFSSRFCISVSILAFGFFPTRSFFNCYTPFLHNGNLS